MSGCHELVKCGDLVPQTGDAMGDTRLNRRDRQIRVTGWEGPVTAKASDLGAEAT